MDAYWKEHEWMNMTHSVDPLATTASDRVFRSSTSARAGVERPNERHEREDGNVIYEMSETAYAAAEVAKHMELPRCRRSRMVLQALAIWSMWCTWTRAARAC